MVNLILPEEFKRPFDASNQSNNSEPGKTRFSKFLLKAFALLMVIALIGGGYWAWQNGYFKSLGNFKLNFSLPDLRPKLPVAPAPTPSTRSSSPSATPSAQILPNLKPSFSTSSNLPKGKIVFIREGNLWTIDQSGQKQLTKYDPAQELAQLPLFSPDVSKILFVDLKKAGSASAELVNYDGSSSQPISEILNYPLDWSSDGKSFMSASTLGGQTSLTIRLISTKGLEIRKISTPLEGASCNTGSSWYSSLLNRVYGSEQKLSFNWLDGNHYLFGAGACGVGDYKVLVDGGVVTSLDITMVNPRPSLDFTQFVGVTSLASQVKSIFLYQSDGTLIKKLDVDNFPSDAILSSDKKTIYFATVKQDDPANPYSFTSTLWKINSDGTSPTKLFDDLHAFRLVPQKVSGDGTLLMYERVSDGNALAQAINTGVSDSTQLTAVAPRIDIYTLDLGSLGKTKVVEDGYQADYTSR